MHINWRLPADALLTLEACVSLREDGCSPNKWLREAIAMGGFVQSWLKSPDDGIFVGPDEESAVPLTVDETASESTVPEGVPNVAEVRASMPEGAVQAAEFGASFAGCTVEEWVTRAIAWRAAIERALAEPDQHLWVESDGERREIVFEDGPRPPEMTL